MEKFIKSPNLPENKVSLVIIDGRARKTIVDKLKDMGICVLLTEKCADLYDAVSYHPDMYIHHLGEKNIISAPNAPGNLVEKLENIGFNIIYGSKYITGKYPYDIAYNVARIGEYAICNISYTDEILIRHLTDMGIKIIDVKQGYAKCSICIIDEKAIITADEGIYSKLKKYDFDVLKISPGYIQLKGFEYGFIGGASGYISGYNLAFAGNIELHPEYKKIEDFLIKHDKYAQALDDEQITDIGTIIPLKEYSIE